MIHDLTDSEISVQWVNVAQLIEKGCRRIAPSWPLDQAISVNPYFGFRDMSMSETASLLHFVAGSSMLMPHDWYDDAPPKLNAAPTMRCFSDLLENQNAPGAIALREAIVHSISQHCASYFDTQQAQWRLPAQGSLYQSWRQSLSQGQALPLLRGILNFKERAAVLPESAETAVLLGLEALHIPIEYTEEYVLCLLYRVNGWASWCAYLDQARNAVAERRELLAICMAIEWMFARDFSDIEIRRAWASERDSWKNFRMDPSADRRWQSQERIERAYQSNMHRILLEPNRTAPVTAPKAQAIFCIDVRSEALRRALETGLGAIQTRGTAGFFGVPMSYVPIGSDTARAQVVQLIAPTYTVKDEYSDRSDIRYISNHEDIEKRSKRRRQDLALRYIFAEWKRSSISKFSFVESLGVFFGVAMLVKTYFAHPPVATDSLGVSRHSGFRPRIVGLKESEAIDLAENVLRGMSFVDGFAPIVCIVGHESCTSNNPQASSLDCGACGGQSGAKNAQALGELLNRPSVRAGLASRGIAIPETTWFCAGIHTTSTDEVTLDGHDLPEGRRGEFDVLQRTMSAAGTRARSERGVDQRVPPYHWANVRPEWGLARNAAIIIAPRARTYAKSLDGRAFLQEYDHRIDTDGSVLAAILAGPLVVAHWISMQYYASTVDAERFGSGNKLLHNVVGGSIGVFEGNGGDLRIGISRQALHDGKKLIHTPLRLAAWIEAPRERITIELLKNEMVCGMIAGEWLTLYAIDPESETPYRALATKNIDNAYQLSWEPAPGVGSTGENL